MGLLLWARSTRAVVIWVPSQLTVGGDVIGGGGTHSGAITTFRDIASVAIGGSLAHRRQQHVRRNDSV